MQQADPSLQLLKALEDVANVTKTLEEERQRHQEKVNLHKKINRNDTPPSSQHNKVYELTALHDRIDNGIRLTGPRLKLFIH